ncbi:MAG TPA: cohesin domain-containing protein [Anaerolineaceae bacterium]|nr:cohesin domain-containing protein [Anaerolineaceae bacterium]HPA34395.1 cohesin domain-containing protein [Anaerolineaceae bacterium]HQF46747.1 cohesin domain-containing protein [Anaerolineaceae bacterium]HQH36619.1 cohesin domain-containing protein [Anaerolineaceae bacterium]HQJ04627.1 cohesin domain-containing protein [Anaerolineaceae bacterium]
MKTPLFKIQILISLAMALAACLALPASVFSQEPGTVVYINPAETTLEVGQETTIAVSVRDVQDLYGYALRITFPPGSIEILDVVNGEFLSDGLMAPTNGWNNTTGEILFDMSMMGEPEGRDGSGDLIRITLRATTPGATVAFTIDPVYSQLVNWPAVMPIPFEIENGVVIINPINTLLSIFIPVIIK